MKSQLVFVLTLLVCGHAAQAQTSWRDQQLSAQRAIQDTRTDCASGSRDSNSAWARHAGCNDLNDSSDSPDSDAPITQGFSWWPFHSNTQAVDAQSGNEGETHDGPQTWRERELQKIKMSKNADADDDGGGGGGGGAPPNRHDKVSHVSVKAIQTYGVDIFVDTDKNGLINYVELVGSIPGVRTGRMSLNSFLGGIRGDGLDIYPGSFSAEDGGIVNVTAVMCDEDGHPGRSETQSLHLECGGGGCGMAGPGGSIYLEAEVGLFGFAGCFTQFNVR